MLPRIVELRDVYDLERLCHVIVDATARGRGQPLQRADREEAIAFLLSESYVLAGAYDASREATGATFRGFLIQRLRWRISDHINGPYGTRREPRLGQGWLVDLHAGADSPGGGDPLDEALGREPCHIDDDWAEALGGVHAPGDRDVVRALAGYGLGAAPGASRRARADRRDRVAA
jgi:hypothetical protein